MDAKGTENEGKQRGIITSVHKRKGRPPLYEVYIDERAAVIVTEEMIVRDRILPGLSVDPAQVQKWEQECEESVAYSKALDWLSARPRSAAELKRYLRDRGWDEETAQKTLDRCVELGYIDDLKLAIDFVERRIGGQKIGRLRVADELRQRGVASALIEEALRRFDESDEEGEWERALLIARKKWAASYKNREQQRRRTGTFLLRRGFDTELVIKLLDHLENEHDPEEDHLT